MDGGEIELNVILDVLHNELGINIPVAGMVKDNHHRTSHLITGEDGHLVPLDPRSQGFFLLTRIQDEVHRFAITFHRKTHNKNALSSQLEMIKGVGPKTRTKLLQKYHSISKIKTAPVKDLMKLGISQTVAETIKLTLNKISHKKVS